MDVRIVAEDAVSIEGDWLVVPIGDSAELTGQAAAVDSALDGLIGRLRESGDAEGKARSLCAVPGLTECGASRLLLVGLGSDEAPNLGGVRDAYAAAARRIAKREAQSAVVVVPHIDGLDPENVARAVADAMTVGCAGQDLYRSERKLHPLRELVLTGESIDEHARAAREGHAIGEAVNLTRELVNRMPEEMDPAGFAERAERVAEAAGLSCRIFEEEELRAERMNALLAVARGSTQPPRMVVLEYFGGEKNGEELALVGKGVTFDSGGLSLKPSDSMKSMKADMAGAATVLGAMLAIARLKLPVNVVGFMGLVENMPGAGAFKLGDVLTARNGVTIEVHNTDAEGRLVLADVLSYAVDRGADRIVDLATLTGACVVALGEDVTGAFTNDQQWCDQLLEAARRQSELVWQLPMFDLYSELINGDVADIKNVGPRWGGAITAAKFLERFVGATPWVHLDIAGPSFASSGNATRDGGGTGCMVRTLVELAGTLATPAAE